MINGDACLDKNLIPNHVIDFYNNFFNDLADIFSEDVCTISDVIPSLVSAEDNLFLTRVPRAEEVKLATFGLNKHIAPGPDGFGGSFYQSC